jgi:hypothetical protein
MMEDRFNEIFVESEKGSFGPKVPSPPGNYILCCYSPVILYPDMCSRADKPKHVRVLWDIEIIGISKKRGGLATVTKLQRCGLFSIVSIMSHIKHSDATLIYLLH